MKTWSLAALLTAIALLARTAGAAPLPMRVLPTENHSGDIRFDSLLISEGIANLVAQEFYDTGRFVPVEDKEEINRRLRDMADNDGQTPETAAVARAEIVRVRVSRMRGMLAFLGGARTTVTTTVRVTVRIGDQPPLVAEGKAAATTKAAGAFFEVRSDRIAFDATSTGRTVQQAVREAVRKITASIEEQEK